MKLDVPLVKQEKDSFDCGLAGLSMVLAYYGIDKSTNDIRKDVAIYQNVGTFMPQLGEYLLDEGFEVEIITLNPYLFTQKNQDWSQEQICSYFEKYLQKIPTDSQFRACLAFFISFMKKGGRVTVKIPTFTDVKEEIDNKRPVCAILSSNVLDAKQPAFNFHFNIIKGYDKNNIIVNDPLWDERGGEKKYNIDEYFYAIYASAHGDFDNASIMTVRKKSNTS